ncbi:hypothetical protein GTW10_24010 [Aurantimonas endophytica]|uniref:hypothetical protein n=1 Tax=Aurantimonas endophytica TaxID=1522175 RepID=UPI002094FB9A|nr:hypothetical protein [Aurantimonas endophytica]MCO6406536.1 hypothetical protein [Aurantimonas endophytica]
MRLPLAVDIADRVIEVTQAAAEFDIAEIAQRLVAGHPEAETSVAEVVETLQEELSAAEGSPSQAGS